MRHARPSIDVLFRSAAEAYRERCVGVVLTGANEDGAEGLALIKKLGGVAVVQDPRTAERREMPSAAIEATNADIVLPLEEIGLFLRGLLLETCTPEAARRSRRWDSNPRPLVYKSSALPTELLRRSAAA